MAFACACRQAADERVSLLELNMTGDDFLSREDAAWWDAQVFAECITPSHRHRRSVAVRHTQELPSPPCTSTPRSQVFRKQDEMLQFGGDPDFKRRESRKFICDATYCDEMKCKCKKYCRCRGVPIAMFEGEDDSNSRGPPKADGGAPGFEPWHPDIETEYTFNTEPPREGD